jgi:hypothetical protein
MAKMIPHIAYETGSEGENRVFEMLQSLLPDSYTVLHSLRWIGSDRRRSQGEADFVVFHPEKGVMVIEVKAGIITLDNNRTWYQTNRRTNIRKEMFDPEKQADESKFKLISLLKGINCMVCHAVWFTSISFNKGHLPPNYSPEMLFDINSLKDPKKALETAFSFWSQQLNRTTSLNKPQETLVLEALAPSFNLVPSIRIDYEYTEERFVKLTNEQTIILNYLQLQNKAAIAGAAGTGKTFIALEKARQLEQQGAKVLFLCYNRMLIDFLNDAYSHYNIHICTFDSLARKYVGEQKDFETTRVLFLDYLLEPENDFEYTDIIIDEGQDFASDWIEYLEYRLDDNAHFYVFYDQKQCIYKDDINKWLREVPCRLTLFTNCRNTEAIAKTSYGSLGKSGGKQPNLSGIEGEQAKLIPLMDAKSLSKWIDKTVNAFQQATRTDLSNIAILTLDKMEKSILGETIVFSKLKCSESKVKGTVCRTTSRKFKGLEADMVIITDLDWNKMEDVIYRQLFYTSCSRAKHKLYIVSPEINNIDIESVLINIQSDNSKRKGKRRFLKLFNLKENEVI